MTNEPCARTEGISSGVEHDSIKPGKELKGDSIAITIAIASLLVVALLESIPLVLGQSLPTVPLFAQVFFVLRREILPTLIVLANSIFLPGREIAPIVVRRRHWSSGQQQQQSQSPNYCLSIVHQLSELRRYPI